MKQLELTKMGFAFDRLLRSQNPVFADRREYTSGHDNPVHMHDYAQIWYCYRGKYSHRIKDRVYECEKGSVVVVPPGTVHAIICEQEVDIMNLNVRFDILLDTPPGPIQKYIYQSVCTGVFSGSRL